MMRLFTARRSVIAISAVTACALSGCGLGSGLYNVSLPGGADVGDHPYTLTAEFSDAEDLVPQAGVRVNDVPVGKVSAIDLDSTGKIAKVKVEVNGSVQLPRNAVASVQQTSLLGEKYVALSAPLQGEPVGRLRGGDTIPASRTTNGVEVEQVFGALSLLLNEGGLGQLDEIYRELNKFAGNNTDGVRTFFASVKTVVTNLNTNRTSITRALDALGTLSDSLRNDNDQIKKVLSSLAPGIDVIAQQRSQLVGALDAFNRLATVTTRTLDASKDDIIADFNAIKPILANLAEAGSALPKSLQTLLTYPFPDGAVEGIKGDYINGFANLVLQTRSGTYDYNQPTPVLSPQQQRRFAASGPQSVPIPSGLLPATSSAASGLPSTLTFSPSGSASGSASGSKSGSGSASGSQSSGSGSPSNSGSGSGSAGSSGSGSSTPGGRTSTSGGTSSGSTSSSATAGGTR